MRKLFIIALSIIFLFSSLDAFGVESMYCAGHQDYINVGMTVSQVVAACGEPLSKQKSDKPVMRKIPVLQILYNNAGAPTAFYGVWNMKVGNNTGTQLQVNIVNNKVSSIQINGGDANAFSICNGNQVQVGDPVANVYNACGTPSVVNRTYINQPVPSKEPPEVWNYQTDEYQPPYSLTFVNGILQSID